MLAVMVHGVIVSKMLMVTRRASPVNTKQGQQEVHCARQARQVQSLTGDETRITPSENLETLDQSITRRAEALLISLRRRSRKAVRRAAVVATALVKIFVRTTFS